MLKKLGEAGGKTGKTEEVKDGCEVWGAENEIHHSLGLKGKVYS